MKIKKNTLILLGISFFICVCYPVGCSANWPSDIAKKYKHDAEALLDDWDEEEQELLEDFSDDFDDEETEPIYTPAIVQNYLPRETQNGTTFYGAASLKNKSLDHLTVMGPLTLSDSNVHGKIDVYGPLIGYNITSPTLNIQGPAQIRKSKVGTLTINGPLTLQDTVVSGASTINGPLTIKGVTLSEAITINGPIFATQSTFKNKISVSAEKLSFTDCTLQALEIRPSDTILNPQQVLYLKGKTEVFGDIIFLGGNGKIIKDTSVVIKGKIEGAS